MPFVASGTYGCVFKPPLRCKANTQEKIKHSKKDSIGKVFGEVSDYYNEKQILDFISNLDPDGEFTVPLEGSCVIEDILRDNDQVYKCPLIDKRMAVSKSKSARKSSEELQDTKTKSYYQLVYSYGGKSLGQLIKTRRGTMATFVKLLKASIPIIKGIQKMTEMKVVHQDIKEDNVLWNGNKLLLIDFGLASSFSDVYTKQNHNVLTFDYPYFPPEYKLFAYKFKAIEEYHRAYSANFKYMFKANGKFHDLYDIITKHFGIDVKTELTMSMTEGSTVFDCSKIDIYGLGIVLLDMFIWCKLVNTKYCRRVCKQATVISLIKELLKGMIHPHSIKRISAQTALERINDILNIYNA